jgi:hypothetical protein
MTTEDEESFRAAVLLGYGKAVEVHMSVDQGGGVVRLQDLYDGVSITRLGRSEQTKETKEVKSS